MSGEEEVINGGVCRQLSESCGHRFKRNSLSVAEDTNVNAQTENSQSLFGVNG